MVDKIGSFCIVGKKLPIKGNCFTFKCPPLYKGVLKELPTKNYLVGN